MNKVVLMGRLTKNPEVRYAEGENPVAVGRYTLAVNRRWKKEGEAEADFIPCIVFGKAATFAEKYFSKGQMIGIVGRMQVRNWTDKDGNKRRNIEVVVEEQHFAGSKNENQEPRREPAEDGFYPVSEDIEDDDLPF